MTGRRAQRLVLGWALKQRNPADLDAAGKPRPYGAAWAAFQAEAERCVTDSARLAGLPQEFASALRFSSGALVEPVVERRSLEAWMVPGSRGSRRRQLQAVFNVGPAPCESTHVHAGEYAAASVACAAGTAFADLADVAAELCRPREAVEALLKPVATLQPGEGAGFLGEVIHAGDAEGGWRAWSTSSPPPGARRLTTTRQL